MEHRLLRSFVAVAEELHFGKAARRLHISQPPLSIQIRKLEEDLGVQLFERSRHGVALTEAGSVLLGRARHLLGEAARARDAVERAARGESGVLSVGYTPTATYELLPRLVPKFRESRPGVRLDLTEMRSPLLPDAIREGRIDVAFVCAPVDARDLTECVLERERPFVALPAGHRLSRLPRVHVRDLRDEPFVNVDPEVEPGWARAASAALSAAGLTPLVVQETDTKIALLGLIAAGLGLSIVSESMTNLGRIGVTLRPLAGVSLRFALSLLAPERPTARAAEFLRLARKR